MTLSKIRKSISLAALLLCLFAPCSGICSPSQTYQISETQMTQLESILNGLESDNEMLQNLLTESSAELQTATDESERLKTLLTRANHQLTELQKQLQALKQESENARTSLDEANRELKLASESYKKSMQEHAQIEGRLRTQRNIWTVIACILGGVAAVR